MEDLLPASQPAILLISSRISTPIERPFQSLLTLVSRLAWTTGVLRELLARDRVEDQRLQFFAES